MTDAVTSGIDTAELDPATRPQDDLFRHVNGKWIDRTELPADKARYGSFHILHEEAEEAIRTIIEESQHATPGTDARKAGDLFASFMDEAAIEAKGAAPLVPLLAEVDAVDSVDALLATIGRLERAGGPGFVHLYVDNDPGDPERYLLNVVQGGLGLPDESYYREDKFAEIRTAYRAFVEELLALAGVDDAAARAERIVALEHEIAAAHWDKVESRDAQKTYNLLTWDAVAELAGAAPLAGWRDAMGLAPEHTAELIVHQPSALAGIAALVTAERLPAWRDWLAFHTVRSYASSLSDAFVQANFGFYGRTLTGTPEIRARWKRGVSLVEGVLGEAVGRVYVERHFPPAAKAAMDELVADLIEAYRRSIGSLEWMGPETRRRALEKLEKFTPKIGFPVKWRDYGTLEIVADDLIANQRAAAEFEFQRELAKLGRPIDRDEWFMTPQTVNAYYNPGFNEIVFPAAILQPPFFSAERDAAANYGAIGAVIGHEIGHGFDDQGSRFDGDGRLIDWWTEADRAAFEERTGSLIAQYDALVPEQLDGDPEQHVNGALTIGENIGDLGGLGIAWQAYLVHLERQGLTEGPVIDGLTAAQRFFLSWAQAWQQKGRDEEVIRLLAIDPHSPSEFRCNQIVRNIPAFYEAFGLTEADRLWLAEPERVTIW
ncbi:MAG TPA: M13-type metalloendopeptidase [Microbacteriaceae bacterium]|nr:M13-type metalloendopeptidase [Microbacteriaceae bacterium]